MYHCECKRCGDRVECLAVVFLEDGKAWMNDTLIMLCEGCYSTYKELYKTYIQEESDDESECDE